MGACTSKQGVVDPKLSKRFHEIGDDDNSACGVLLPKQIKAEPQKIFTDVTDATMDESYDASGTTETTFFASFSSKVTNENNASSSFLAERLEQPKKVPLNDTKYSALNDDDFSLTAHTRKSILDSGTTHTRKSLMEPSMRGATVDDHMMNNNTSRGSTKNFFRRTCMEGIDMSDDIQSQAHPNINEDDPTIKEEEEEDLVETEDEKDTNTNIDTQKQESQKRFKLHTESNIEPDDVLSTFWGDDYTVGTRMLQQLQQNLEVGQQSDKKDEKLATPEWKLVTELSTSDDSVATGKTVKSKITGHKQATVETAPVATTENGEKPEESHPSEELSAPKYQQSQAEKWKNVVDVNAGRLSKRSLDTRSMTELTDHNKKSDTEEGNNEKSSTRRSSKSSRPRSSSRKRPSSRRSGSKKRLSKSPSGKASTTAAADGKKLKRKTSNAEDSTDSAPEGRDKKPTSRKSSSNPAKVGSGTTSSQPSRVDADGKPLAKKKSISKSSGHSKGKSRKRSSKKKPSSSKATRLHQQQQLAQ